MTPAKFSEVASSVALIRTFDCGGNAQESGSGFLVGSSVVVTARHVVDWPGGHSACIVKVRVNGAWVRCRRERSSPDQGD